MTAVSDLLGFRLRKLWRFFASQDVAYWAVCFYLFVEYVRPQQLLRPLYGMPLGQISLAIALLARVLSGRWLSVKGLGSWLFLLFTAVIFASSIAASDPSVSVAHWRLWFSWVVIYFLIVNVVDSEQRLVLFVLLWMLFHLYMSQGATRQFAGRGFRFASYGVTGAPGWFANSGEFGIAMCMFLSVSWHYYLAARAFMSRWRKIAFLTLPTTAVLSIIGSSSRGALLALGALGAWGLLRTRYRVRAAIGLVVLALLVWGLVPEGSKKRLSVMGEDTTSTRRLTYWKRGLEMASRYPVLGVGYANWLTYYERNYPERVGAWERSSGVVQQAHNVFIECVAELGYVGIGSFALLIAATFLTNFRTRRTARAGPSPPDRFAIQMAYGFDGALVGLLVGGFFISVLYYPFFWINLALTVTLDSVTHRNHRRYPAASASRAASGVAACNTVHRARRP